MQLAVSTMLVGGFQASWKPVLWLEAFPTASGIPGSRSAAVFTNLAVIIPTVTRVTQIFWLSIFS